MMQRSLQAAIGAVVISALLLSSFGCATPGSAPPTVSPPDATAPPASQGQVIELKYHWMEPPVSYVSENVHNRVARLIEEKTNGAVKVICYPGETLGKAKDGLDMAANGIADISHGYIGNHPGQFPITDLLGLPMMGGKSAAHGSSVAQEIYKTTTELQKEWSRLGVHVLCLHTVSPHQIGFSSKRAETMEDLKGLRLRAIAGAPLKFLQALGATPVTVPTPETFEALQKGTIDGYCTDWNGIGSYKFCDISQYVLEAQMYCNPFYVVMGQKRWDSLPPEIQEALSEVFESAAVDIYGKGWDGASNIEKENSLKAGVEVLTLSDEERTRWENMAQQVWSEYISIVDAEGANGNEIVEKIKAIYAKHNP